MDNFTKKYPYIICLLIDIALLVIQLAVNKCKRIIREEGNK